MLICDNIRIYLTMRYIKLKEKEIEALKYLHRKSPNRTVRKRSQCLNLSHQRLKINDLASFFMSVSETLSIGFITGLKRG